MAKSDDPPKVYIEQTSCFPVPAPSVDPRLSTAASEIIPFESLLDAMPEFIIYYDQDLKVLWANRAAAADHGLKPHEMIGKSFFQVGCMVDPPCKGCPVISGMDSDCADAIENKPYDGRLFYTRSYPVFQNGRLISGRLFVAQNISNLKDRYSVAETLNLINELFHTHGRLSSICKKLIRNIVSSFGYVYGVITLCGESSDEIIAMGDVDFSGKFPSVKRFF